MYCGAGGASYGYYLAGRKVTGVDISPQPRYPFKFVQADALDYLASADLSGFDLIHASPPCQAWSSAAGPSRRAGKVYPELVAVTRELLEASGRPWVIENVPGAPLNNPITLCGFMFGLRVQRHRLFEASFEIPQLAHPAHLWPTVNKAGDVPGPGQVCSVAGALSDIDAHRAAMGIWWMTGAELCQAIPPAYTHFIWMNGIERAGNRRPEGCMTYAP